MSETTVAHAHPLARSGVTDPATVTVPLWLYSGLVGALTWGFTSAGHLAIKNDRERTGGCGWRGCAPGCRERKQLLLAACKPLEQALARRAPERGGEQLEMEMSL